MSEVPPRRGSLVPYSSPACGYPRSAPARSSDEAAASRPQRKAQQSPPLPHGRGAGRGVQGGGIPDRWARPGPLPALEPERVPDVPVEVAPPPSQPSVVPWRALSSCSARRCFLGKRALRWASGQLPPSECREPREHLPVLGGQAINNEKEKGV